MNATKEPSVELRIRIVILALDRDRPWVWRNLAKLAATSILRTNPGVQVFIVRNSAKPCFFIPRRDVYEKQLTAPTPNSHSFPVWCQTERLRLPEIVPEAFSGVDRVIVMDADTLVLGDISTALEQARLVLCAPSDRLGFNREFHGLSPFAAADLNSTAALPADAATGWFLGGPTDTVRSFLAHWYQLTHRMTRTGHTRSDWGALNILIKTGNFPWSFLNSEDFREVHRLPRTHALDSLKAIHFGGRNSGGYGLEFNQGGAHCRGKLRAMFGLWQEAFQFTQELHTLDWLET